MPRSLSFTDEFRSEETVQGKSESETRLSDRYRREPSDKEREVLMVRVIIEREKESTECVI